MMFDISGGFKRESIDIDREIKNTLHAWWDDLHIYVNSLDDDSTWHNIPLLVTSIYKYVGIEAWRFIPMGSIFKMVYLANKIHALVRDEDEDQKYNRELQFNILIGDYIFGCILKKLNKLKADNLLLFFSVMICEINEGMIMKHRLGSAENEVIKKTKASIYTTAFSTAAELANSEDREKELFAQLGYNMGMAIELMNDKQQIKEVFKHVDLCEDLFGEINSRRNIANSRLERVLKELHCSVYGIEKAVVV